MVLAANSDAGHALQNPLAFAAAVLVLVGAIRWLVLRWPANKPVGETCYRTRPALLTSSERKFLKALETAAGVDLRVFAQVRLADLVLITKRRGEKGYQAAFNKVASKHVDFVLCDSEDLAIAGVVELDDRSHDEPHVRSRDATKDAILKSAGIPILRVNVQTRYDPAELRKNLKESFRLPGNEATQTTFQGICPQR